MIDDASLEEIRKQAMYAMKNFEKAIALNPNYTKALWGLTRTHVITGDLAKRERKSQLAVNQYRLALKTFESLNKVDPKFAFAHPKKTAAMEKLKAQLNRHSQ